jgi:vancomycin resistance protein VanJ
MPRLLRHLNLCRNFYVFAWIYIGLIWTWFGLRLVFFDRIWWLSLLNTNAFFLLIPAIVLLPLVPKLRLKNSISNILIIGLILPIILFIWFFGYLLLPPQLKSKLARQENSSSVNSSASKFRLMSFNVLFSNKNYPKIIQSIRSSNPDLIGIQEVQPHHLAALKQALTEYPYSVFHPVPKFHNIALFSRFPIESITILPAQSIERGMSVVVKIQGHPLTVIVAHLTPNYVEPVPFAEYTKLLQSRYTSRAGEIEYLHQYIRSNPHQSIVLCDCNLTNTAQAYPQMAQELSDSFAEVGWGFGHTFQGEDWKFPLQRLDYIWHTNRLTAVDAHVGTDGGSDHLPLLADFNFH